MMVFLRRRFTLLAACETAIVIAASLIWFHLRTAAYLASPTDSDTYAHALGFQWMMFGGFYLPGVLLANGMFLVCVRLLTRSRS